MNVLVLLSGIGAMVVLMFGVYVFADVFTGRLVAEPHDDWERENVGGKQ